MSWSKSICAAIVCISALYATGSSRSQDSEPKEGPGPGNIHGLARGNRRLKVIEDFATGQCWRLERNGDHPDWPATLVRIAGVHSCPDSFAAAPGIYRSRTTVPIPPPVIVRDGDVLAISDETPAVRANLEGVALGSGREGDSIRVRLRVSRSVMRARIVARGKVLLTGTSNEVYR